MAETELTSAQVRHVAKLAALACTDQEIETMRSQLVVIVGHMKDLDALDLVGIEPTFYPVPLAAPLRLDVMQDGLSQSEALAAAPSSEAGGFAVPKVLEGEA